MVTNSKYFLVSQFPSSPYCPKQGRLVDHKQIGAKLAYPSLSPEVKLSGIASPAFPPLLLCFSLTKNKSCKTPALVSEKGCVENGKYLPFVLFLNLSYLEIHFHRILLNFIRTVVQYVYHQERALFVFLILIMAYFGLKLVLASLKDGDFVLLFCFEQEIV